ncbi:MAG: WbqC family protein [Pseudomonadales bacterium]|nr:WbqC family protein [Pseudomonadales bacterium]
MSKKVAILQSNYIPWKGYFDLISAVDEFILYDDMQYTKNDWRNRNQVKTPNGVEWISIPVGKAISRRIRDVELSNSVWQKKHWRTLEMSYRRSPYFNDVAEWLSPLYLSIAYTSLSQVNRLFLEAICSYLGINTVISNSWDYQLIEGKSERLADLCLQAGASEYISGPAARAYLDKQAFEAVGIELSWFEYSDYPEYPQLWGEFSHGVTILDLLFNCGKDANQYMKYTTNK